MNLRDKFDVIKIVVIVLFIVLFAFIFLKTKNGL